MSYQIVWLAKAKQELISAWEWYEDKQSGLGDRLEIEVDKTLDYIEEHPSHFPLKKKKYRGIN